MDKRKKSGIFVPKRKKSGIWIDFQLNSAIKRKKSVILGD